jgi:hypothetical protein
MSEFESSEEENEVLSLQLQKMHVGRVFLALKRRPGIVL